MSRELTYRLAAEGDLAGIKALWERESNWGRYTRPMQRFYQESPWGPPVVVVAEEENGREQGAIVGHILFVPVRISVDGGEVAACRPYAAIVAGHVRIQSRDPALHPLVRLSLLGLEASRERGARIFYTLPNRRVVSFFQVDPGVRISDFSLWSCGLPLGRRSRAGRRYTAGAISRSDARLDALWERARDRPGCRVVLDRSTVRWKTSIGRHVIVGVESQGRLVGAVVCRDRGRQWQILDLLADDPELVEATIAAATRIGDERARSVESSPLRKATVLAAPEMYDVLERLGFEADDYTFSLVVKALDGELTEQISPERWRLSAND
jgi:hypothetical protein